MEHESRGLGATEPEKSVGEFEIGTIIVESLSLTLKTMPRWIFPGLVLGGVWALLTWGLIQGCQLDSDLAFNLSMLPILLLAPAFMACYLRVLLSAKRGEGLGLSDCLSFGIRRSPRLLISWLGLGLVFALLYVLVIAVFAGLCYVGAPGVVLAIPLGVALVVAFVYYCLRWQLALVAGVLEERVFLSMLSRSAELSQGRVGAIFVSMLAASMLYGMIMFGVVVGFAVVAGVFGALSLGETAVGVVVVLGCLFFGLLYMISCLLPTTVQFLCYYYITRGRELAPDLEFDNGFRSF